MALNVGHIYTDEPNVVIYLLGKKCEINIKVDYEEDSAAPIDANLRIDFTEKPLTEKSTTRGYYKWGWFPTFLQNEVYPTAADGRPYTFICTVCNNWGDCGNANVFALLKEHDTGFFIEDVYVEYSCY